MPTTHPDFAYIQGLAEAGYLPSPLTGDTNEKTFRPDAALTRETLLRWKVPVDQQKLLPTVTTSKIQEVWGFKDADKVSPDAASAIVADQANQELSNVRRLIGASLLLQPQKAVTRAEAAAALWYFGVDGKGVSAKDVVRAEIQAVKAEPEEGASPPSPETAPDRSPSDSNPPATDNQSPSNQAPNNQESESIGRPGA